MPSAIKTHAAENARDIHARAQTAELLLGPAWLLCVWFLRKMTLGCSQAVSAHRAPAILRYTNAPLSISPPWVWNSC